MANTGASSSEASKRFGDELETFIDQHASGDAAIDSDVVAPSTIPFDTKRQPQKRKATSVPVGTKRAPRGAAGQPQTRIGPLDKFVTKGPLDPSAVPFHRTFNKSHAVKRTTQTKLDVHAEKRNRVSVDERVMPPGPGPAAASASGLLDMTDSIG